MVSTQDRLRENLKNKFLREFGIENPTDEMMQKLDAFDENDLMKPTIQRMIKEGKTQGQIINAIGCGVNKDAMIARIHRLKKRSY